MSRGHPRTREKHASIRASPVSRLGSSPFTREARPAHQRNLFNRLLGQLYHCLQHGARFDEAIAFPTAAEALAA
ncbi:hypothetical protein EAO68_02080 [Streptomyces sp. wa22]|nr:hypothetical protein EAO68_02080 [Streptomyces sp. wa22]